MTLRFPLFQGKLHLNIYTLPLEFVCLLCLAHSLRIIMCV